MPSYPLNGAPTVVDGGASASILVTNTGAVPILVQPGGVQVLPAGSVTRPGWSQVPTTLQTAGPAGSADVTLTAGSPAARPGPGPVTFDASGIGPVSVTIVGGAWFTNEGLTAAASFPLVVSTTSTLWPAAPASCVITGTAGGVSKSLGMNVSDGSSEVFRFGDLFQAGTSAGSAELVRAGLPGVGSNTYASLPGVALSALTGIPSPRTVIWDTDWWTDVDDTVGLRILLHAERIGLVNIGAIVVDTKLAMGPGSISAMLAFENRDNVPIGVHPTYVPSGTPPYQTNLYQKWPHRVGLHSTALPSTEVYRRALAAADDGSVDILAHGYLTALSDLLQSTADSVDARTGLQLVTAKVRHLWVAAGKWPLVITAGAENNFGRDSTAAAAANYIVVNWPGQITFTGYEVGADVYTGQILSGASSATTDPLAQALNDYSALTTGRQSWGAMGSWVAAVGDPETAGYVASAWGTATVNATTGVNSFAPGVNGKHRYLNMAMPPAWFQSDLNQRLVPGQDPPVASAKAAHGGTTRGAAVIRNPPAPLFARTARTTGALAANLMFHFDATDLTDLADTTTLSHWADRMLGTPAQQFSVPAQPTKSTVGGQVCAAFASGQWLAIPMTAIPRNLSIYVRARFTGVPGTNMSIVSADENLISDGRKFAAVKALSTGTAAGVGFRADGVGATSTTATLTANTWQTIGSVIAPDTNVTAYLDGTAATPATVFAPGQNSGYSHLAIGSRYYQSSTEPLVGYVREIRIYGATHDASTVAAVVAAMNV